MKIRINSNMHHNWCIVLTKGFELQLAVKMAQWLYKHKWIQHRISARLFVNGAETVMACKRYHSLNTSVHWKAHSCQRYRVGKSSHLKFEK